MEIRGEVLGCGDPKGEWVVEIRREILGCGSQPSPGPIFQLGDFSFSSVR